MPIEFDESEIAIEPEHVENKQKLMQPEHNNIPNKLGQMRWYYWLLIMAIVVGGGAGIYSITRRNAQECASAPAIIDQRIFEPLRSRVAIIKKMPNTLLEKTLRSLIFDTLKSVSGIDPRMAMLMVHTPINVSAADEKESKFPNQIRNQINDHSWRTCFFAGVNRNNYDSAINSVVSEHPEIGRLPKFSIERFRILFRKAKETDNAKLKRKIFEYLHAMVLIVQSELDIVATLNRHAVSVMESGQFKGVKINVFKDSMKGNFMRVKVDADKADHDRFFYYQIGYGDHKQNYTMSKRRDIKIPKEIQDDKQIQAIMAGPKEKPPPGKFTTVRIYVSPLFSKKEHCNTFELMTRAYGRDTPIFFYEYKLSELDQR